MESQTKIEQRAYKSIQFRAFVQRKYHEYCNECLCWGLCKTQLGFNRYVKKNKWFLKREFKNE